LTLDGNWSSTAPDQIFGTSESRSLQRRQNFSDVFIALASQQKCERKTSLAILPNSLAIGCSTNPDFESNQLKGRIALNWR
jgi:hypothetical protein